MPDLSTASAVVGANVRAEMSRRGMNQSAVAARLGLAQASISARLRGVTPFDINELVQLTRVLEVPLERLTDGADLVEASA